MVGQGRTVGIGLHGGKLGDLGLVIEVQLKGHLLGVQNDVPQLLMDGVGVVHVRMDGAQQVQGVAVALRLPQQTQGAGVLLVI